MTIFILLFVALTTTAYGQIPSGTSDPPTPCAVGQQYVWLGAADNQRMLFICDSSGWHQQGNVGNVTAADLSATGSGKGAESVGFINTPTGSVARPLAGKVRETFSLADAGCVLNGSTDVGECMNTAMINGFAAGFTEISIQTGVGIVNRQIHIPHDVTLVGRGQGNNAVTAGNWIKAGSTFPKPAYASLTTGTSTTITCSSACGLHNSDIIVLSGLTGDLVSLNEVRYMVTTTGPTATSFTIDYDSTGKVVAGTPVIHVPMAVYGYIVPPPGAACTAFHSRVVDVTIDGNGNTDTGFVNWCGQENSGLFRSNAYNFGWRGVLIATASTMNSELQSVNVNCGAYGSPSTVGVRLKDALVFRRFTGASIQGGSGTGVLVTGTVGGSGVIEDIHVERASVAVQLGLDGAPASGVRLQNITGDLRPDASMASLINIFTGSTAISIHHAVKGYATNVITDTVDSCTDAILASYWLGAFTTPQARSTSCNARTSNYGPSLFLSGLTVAPLQRLHLPRYGVPAQVSAAWQNAGELWLGKDPDGSQNVGVVLSHDGTTKDLAVDASGNTTIAGSLTALATSSRIGFAAPYPNSVARTAQDELGLVVNPKQFGATGDGTTNDSTALLNTLTYKNASMAASSIFLPSGVYKVDPGILSFDNPHSTQIRGANKGLYGTKLLSSGSSTQPILSLGDGTYQVFDHRLDSFGIDAAGISTTGALTIRSFNLSYFDDFRIWNFLDGVGLKAPTSGLFQEMYFHRFEIVGNGYNRGTCADLSITGNIEFTHSNFENCGTAVKVRGRRLSRVTISTAHIERVSTALDIDDARVTADINTISGAILLGSGVQGSKINLSPAAGWYSGFVSDAGFGNQIDSGGDAHANLSYGVQRQMINTKGDEWMRVSNYNSNPFWDSTMNGQTPTDWSSTNASSQVVAQGLPGSPTGKALQITATAANGYVSKTFSLDINTDYLLQIAFVLTPPNSAYPSYPSTTGNTRVEILNSGGSIYDSGAINFDDVFGTKVKIWRRRIPVNADGSLTLRIYAVNQGGMTIVPFVLLNKSSYRFEATGLVGGGGDFTATGIGATYQKTFTSSMNTATQNTSVNYKTPSFVRLVASCTGSCFAGITGDSNADGAGPVIPLSATPTEYVIPLSYFPTNSVIKFYTYDGNSHDLTLSEFGIYPIEFSSYGDWSMQGVVKADREVVAKVASYTLTDADRGITFTNSSATGPVTLTTYKTVPKRWNRFCVDAAQNLVVAVPAGTVIQTPGSTSISGGNVTSNQVGACVELQAISSTKVQAVLSGTWTVN